MAKAIVNVKSENKKPARVVPVVQVRITEGVEAITKNIMTIEKAGKALETLIHDTAMSTLVHADKHGDVTLANKLIEAIPSLVRKNALRDWFQAYGKFGFDEETNTLTFKKAKKTEQDTAGQNPFWSFKAEAKYVPFVLSAEIIKLVQRAEKSQGDKTRKKDVIPAAQLEAIRNLVKQA